MDKEKELPPPVICGRKPFFYYFLIDYLCMRIKYSEAIKNYYR